MRTVISELGGGQDLIMSETFLAIKTKSLTVKCITYRIYSKYRKLRETLFNYRNLAVDIK